MRRIPSAVTFFCFAVFLAAGCSVKENREDCPCTLVLDFIGVDAVHGTFVDIDFCSADGFFERTSVNLGEKQTFEFKVPRTDLYVNAYYGDGGYVHEGAGLLIPENSQCPPIYMNALHLDTDREYLRAEVLPRKNFCNVEVCFEDIASNRYDAFLMGSICGYAFDGHPLRGKFSCSLLPDQVGRCNARVPRQEDASLCLRIVGTDGHIKNFALGEYILESGFDWTSPDLDDVIVEINYARTEITFRIKDWEKTVSFDVII